MHRRAFLATIAAAALAARTSAARGRTPIGGRISLRLPWSLASIDPHRLDDAAAAFFGDALFDGLYAPADGGGVVAALAEGDPAPDGASLRVTLRSGLRTGKGRPFGTKDAAFAIARARSLGAKGWLADVPPPREDGRSLVFATRDAARLVRALSSPLVAMVPNGFSPESPDGTGPFKYFSRNDAVAFVRNPLAARGPSFLDEIVVRHAPTLKASLLSFESGTDDIGWLGDGLHEPRPGSRRFDLGAVAFPVLCTGRDANQWDMPGIAQRLCDEIPRRSLSHLQVGADWPTEPEQGWGGPPTTLLVRDDSPWLVELAQAVAARISRPQHEVTPRPVPAPELAQRRVSRLYGLALDVVRPVAPGAFGALVALANADNPARAGDVVKHPPKLGDVSPRTMTRTLRLGVVGEIRVQGGRAPDVVLAPSERGVGCDFGASSRTR